MTRKFEVRKKARSGALILGALGLSAVAWAHSAGLSRGEYRYEDATLFATITFARGEVSDLVPRLDANLDGVVSASEVAEAKPAMQQAIVNGAKVTTASGTCKGTLDDAKLVEGDGLELTMQWACAPGNPGVQVELDFLDSLTRGHRHLLTLVDAPSGAPSFAYREEPRFSLIAAHTIPRAGWAERFRLSRLGALSCLAPACALLLLLGFGGTARELSRTSLAFVLTACAVCVVAAHAGFSPRLAFPGAALAFLFVGVEGLCAGPAAGRWAAALAVGAAQGVWLSERIADVPTPLRERSSAALPFALGAALALGVASACGVPAAAAASRRAFWPARSVPLMAALALGIGAWWLIRGR